MAHGVADFSKTVGDWAKANPEWAKAASWGALGVGAVGGTALTYGALSGLMNGFGLKGSAVALDGSARALTAAAERIAVSGRAGGPGLPGERAGGPGGSGLPGGRGPAEPPIDRWRVGMTALTTLEGLVETANLPIGSKEWADRSNALDDWLDNLVKPWLPNTWWTPTPKVEPFDPEKTVPTPSLRDLLPGGGPAPHPSSPVADHADRRAEADEIAYRHRQELRREGKDGPLTLARDAFAAVADTLSGELAEPQPVAATPPAPAAPAAPPSDTAAADALDRRVAADYGDRRTVYHDDLERQREADRARAMSGPAGAHADASSLADMKAAAEGSKTVLDTLNATVKPQVDASSIAQAHQALLAFLADLERAGSLSSGLLGSLSAGRASIPELGKASRGYFSTNGIAGA